MSTFDVACLVEYLGTGRPARKGALVRRASLHCDIVSSVDDAYAHSGRVSLEGTVGGVPGEIRLEGLTSGRQFGRNAARWCVVCIVLRMRVGVGVRM